MESKTRNVSIKRAAELMGKSTPFIRIGLQRCLLPFGTAMKLKGGTNYSYYISPVKLADYLGVEVSEIFDGGGDTNEAVV